MNEQDAKIERLQGEFWDLAYDYAEGQRHDHSCDSPRMDEISEEMNYLREQLEQLGADVGECPWAGDEDNEHDD